MLGDPQGCSHEGSWHGRGLQVGVRAQSELVRVAIAALWAKAKPWSCVLVPAVHGEGTGQLQHPGLQLPLLTQGCGRSCNSINELNMLGSAFAIQNNMIMKENYKVIVINGPQVGRELTQAGITLGHGPAMVPGEGGRGGRSWSC